MGTQPKCTCPDFPRSRGCKHMLFIMMKVLGIPAHHPLLWQASYLPNELQYFFEHAPGAAATRLVMAPEEVRRATAAAVGRKLELEVEGDSAAAAAAAVAAAAAEAEAAAAAAAKRKPHSPEDDCGVCFDVLGEDASALISCDSCQNYLHKACFEAWYKARTEKGYEVTCSFCRAPMGMPGAGGSSSSSGGKAASGGAGAGAGAAAAGYGGAGGVEKAGRYFNVAAMMPNAGLAKPADHYYDRYRHYRY